MSNILILVTFRIEFLELTLLKFDDSCLILNSRFTIRMIATIFRKHSASYVANKASRRQDYFQEILTTIDGAWKL